MGNVQGPPDLVSQIGDLRDQLANIQRALIRPTVVLENSAGISLPTGTPTSLTFNTPLINNDKMWSAGSPTAVTINTPGLYAVNLKWHADPNTGTWIVTVGNAGINFLCEDRRIASATIGAGGSLGDVFAFTAGQQIFCSATQASGGTLTISSPYSVSKGPQLSVRWLGTA